VNEEVPTHTFGEIIVASVAAFLSSAVAFVVGVLGGMTLGARYMDGEGRAWSGVSLGIPMGLILALVTGCWTWTRVANYGESLKTKE
jgi:purine-cytosine permease-like protein